MKNHGNICITQNVQGDRCLSREEGQVWAQVIVEPHMMGGSALMVVLAPFYMRWQVEEVGTSSVLGGGAKRTK
jgi:hypothetical protein